VFSNLNWYNVAVLLLLALFIFGDKLPQMIGDGLRLARNLRRMAQNATTDLNRELGTDITLDDLNPKTFVRKHVLSERDQEELTRPLKSVSDDLTRHADDLTRHARGLTEPDAPTAAPAPRPPRYDDVT
jgi:sec-independent protein translocase protein TatB